MFSILYAKLWKNISQKIPVQYCNNFYYIYEITSASVELLLGLIIAICTEVEKQLFSTRSKLLTTVNINNNHTLFLSIAHFAIQICF
jgi:hypothetical protein